MPRSCMYKKYLLKEHSNLIMVEFAIRNDGWLFILFNFMSRAASDKYKDIQNKKLQDIIHRF